MSKIRSENYNEHSNGLSEARYRKGKKPDSSILYGSVYGRTFNEAEKKRAEYYVLLPRKRKTTLKPRSFKRQQKPADLLSNLCKSEFKGQHFAVVESNSLVGYRADIRDYTHLSVTSATMQVTVVNESTVVKSGEIVRAFL